MSSSQAALTPSQGLERHKHRSAAQETTWLLSPSPSPTLLDGGAEPAAKLDAAEAGRLRTLWRENQGLLLVVLSEAFFALMNMTVKKLNGLHPPVPTSELVAIRMIITYICAVAYMLITKVPHPFIGPKGVRLLLLSRGSCGFCGLCAIYFSLHYLSLSDATVLTFLAPSCTVAAGAVLLGEKIRRTEISAGLASLLGVIMIARPTFLFGAHAHEDGVTPAQRLVAVGVSMFGVLGATGAYISIRAIGTRANAMHSISAFAAISSVVSVLYILTTGTRLVLPAQPVWLALLLLIGFFGFAAQIALTLGLQRETAGRGSLGLYAQIVFAGALDLIVLGATPHFLSVVGTGVILAAAVYVALTKQIDKPQSPSAITSPRFLAPDAALEEGLVPSSSAPGLGPSPGTRGGEVETITKADGTAYGKSDAPDRLNSHDS